MLKNNPSNDHIYVGVDEVGRGCLSGPVVAAAVIWNPELEHEYMKYIRDSKKINKVKREMVAEFIKENAIDYSISFINNEIIDNINILNATYMAMHKALDELTVDFEHILVDGNRFTKYNKNNKNKDHTCVIKGDDTYLCIAASSIIAKVARDEYMTKLSLEYPEYKWDKNMGYGTKDHICAIKTHGLTSYHRKTFVKNII